MATDSENEESSRSQSPEVSGDQESGEMIKTENRENQASNGDHSNSGSPEQPKKPSNAKDPSRPRRKKARRACYACQRAHLTCGDERPCQRCIKRGLQDACQDGVRKKAKYLHDAPNEALVPGASSHYQYLNHLRQTQGTQQNSTYQLNPINDVYAQVQPTASYTVYNNATTGGQIPMSENLMNAQAYSTPPAPVSQTFPSAAPPPTSMQGLVQAMESTPQSANATVMQDFSGNLFDGQDMSQFNFDPASFNFGNHYGALEFGMLGHMSSGAAADTALNDTSQMSQASLAAASAIPSSYADQAVSSQPYMFGQDQTLSDWRPPTQSQSNVRQQERVPNTYHPGNLVNQDAPTAFPIAASSSAFASPTSETTPTFAKTIDEIHQLGAGSKSTIAPTSSMPNSRPSTQGHGQAGPSQPHQQGQSRFEAQASSKPQRQLEQQQQQPSSTASWPLSRHHHHRRRRGDPSSVYSTVTQPYSYTSGFHSLIAFLQRRFSTPNTVRIAKALASIRPSFLSCTQNLGREDLVFMEKCFQRQLWEYEEHISATGTPTLVCRRTGEIAAVGKEFSILTGWKKDILLGKEANLNVNTGNNSSSGANMSGAGNNNSTGGKEPASESASAGPPSRSGGLMTPRLPPGTVDTSRPQPVFLAELLDDDSVIAFYEDFARLAFGDSRGGVVTRCKLLKYRSKEDTAALSGSEAASGEGGGKSGKRKRERTLAPAGEVSESQARGTQGNELNGNGEANGSRLSGGVGIDELGDEYGKVESMCCWTVKRDLFDLPMMIVMNFLPCI